jgi:hypothetical protein
MERLTKDPNFYSGAGAETALRLKQFGAALGIADANAERKENARVAKEQADAFDAATAADAQKARDEADAATTEDMIADVAIANIDRLGLDLDRLHSLIGATIANRKFNTEKKAA